MCDMTYSYVCLVSFICVPLLIRICVMPHPCVVGLIHMSLIRDILIRDMSLIRDSDI